MASSPWTVVGLVSANGRVRHRGVRVSSGRLVAVGVAVGGSATARLWRVCGV